MNVNIRKTIVSDNYDVLNCYCSAFDTYINWEWRTKNDGGKVNFLSINLMHVMLAKYDTAVQTKGFFIKSWGYPADVKAKSYKWLNWAVPTYVERLHGKSQLSEYLHQ